MSKAKFFPRKVLISTGELFRYIHGANMVFLELAEYFFVKRLRSGYLRKSCSATNARRSIEASRGRKTKYY